jgi:hypothetical protein
LFQVGSPRASAHARGARPLRFAKELSFARRRGGAAPAPRAWGQPARAARPSVPAWARAAPAPRARLAAGALPPIGPPPSRRIRAAHARADEIELPSSLDMAGAEPSVGDSLYEDPSAAAASRLAPNHLLRVEPLELEWQRIGCSYRAAVGMRVVLQDVYGRASPGEMQARGGGRGARVRLVGEGASEGAFGAQAAGGRFGDSGGVLGTQLMPLGRSFLRNTNSADGRKARAFVGTPQHGAAVPLGVCDGRRPHRCTFRAPSSAARRCWALRARARAR